MTNLVNQKTGSAKFFFLHDGIEVGPCTAAELQEQVQMGQLKSADLVWKAGSQQKREARQVPWLFSSRSPADFSRSSVSAVPARKASLAKNDLTSISPDCPPLPGKKLGNIEKEPPAKLSAGTQVLCAWPILLYESVPNRLT